MTNDLVNVIRCSNLDALFDCTPSVIGDGGLVRINTAGEQAALGKVVHALAGRYIEAGRFDVKAECNRRGFEDEEEAAGLMNYVVRSWDELRRSFPNPQVERVIKSNVIETPAGSFRIEGTADVLSGVGDTGAVFADWKTGYADDGYHNQMFGYAYCIWNVMGRPENAEILGIVAFLRHRYYRVVKYTAKTLAEWEYDLIHNVLSRVNVYRPGKHCTHCPIYHTCDARKAETSGTVQALMLPNNLPANDPYRQFVERVTKLMASVTPDNKNQPDMIELTSQLRFRVKLVEKAVDDARELLRKTVERVGPMPLDNGYELALREIVQRVLDPVKAITVLRKHLSDAEIFDCMKASLPSLLAKKAGKFTRGEKKAAREQLEKELEAAGAITVVRRKRLEEIEPGSEQSNEPE
jgi:hypothetical protein